MRLRPLVFYLLVFLLFITVCFAQVYVETTNFARDTFRDPEEWLLVICYNSTIYKITTREENSIGGGSLQVDMTSVIETLLKKDGLTLVDVASMIHNHRGILKLSEKDKKFLWQLRRGGFQGKFGLYSMVEKRVSFDW